MHQANHVTCWHECFRPRRDGIRAMDVTTDSAARTSFRQWLIGALLHLLSRLQAFVLRFAPPAPTPNAPQEPQDGPPEPPKNPVEPPKNPPEPPHNPPEPERLVSRRDWPEPIHVGARGGVFHFRLFVCLTWSSERLDKATFESEIDKHNVCIQNRILEAAREVASAQPPRKVSKVQDGINNRLAASFAPFLIGSDGMLTCHARVRVAPDRRLQDRLAAHAERLIDVQNDHELRVHRAKLMHGLATEWLEMVKLLHQHPMTAHANRLTDEDFADVIASMTEKRGDKTFRLIRLLTSEDGKG